eukprot:NODE_5744_length_1739_cov_4.274194.p1 GENE.NODE_5744_length_1739_cov_4.274194~~NODE_5744_length_1739_cov_4.274194.p1  ORF type:complete len:372 (+),score=105.74 NODE_5744_length_1739_cov_4.274194:107-1222(+)
MPRVAQCRYYERQYPAKGELVVVQVRRVQEIGAYVSLLEYFSLEGYIPHEEVSVYVTKCFRGVPKMMTVGRLAVCRVVEVDTEMGYLDLSKRQVSLEDAEAKFEAFAKAKAVNGIMGRVAALLSGSGLDIEGIEGLCSAIAWPLYRQHGSAHEALRRHVHGEIDAFAELSGVSAKVKAALAAQARIKLTPQVQKLRATVQVTCEGEDGIDAIREALLLGTRPRLEDAPAGEGRVEIRLVASPVFNLDLRTRQRAEGIALLNESIQAIREGIEARSGVLELLQAPDMPRNAELLEAESLLVANCGEPDFYGGKGEGADDDDNAAFHTEEEDGWEESADVDRMAVVGNPTLALLASEEELMRRATAAAVVNSN